MENGMTVDTSNDTQIMQPVDMSSGNGAYKMIGVIVFIVALMATSAGAAVWLAGPNEKITGNTVRIEGIEQGIRDIKGDLTSLRDAYDKDKAKTAQLISTMNTWMKIFINEYNKKHFGMGYDSEFAGKSNPVD